MADLSLLEQFEDDIGRRVNRGDMHTEVSRYLQDMSPGGRGFSVRSVRRFCASRGIHYGSDLSERELDTVVSRCVIYCWTQIQR